MKRVLCYGDSNTYGYDPRDGGRYDASVRWVDLLGLEGCKTINEGLNGREIPTSDAEYGHLNSVLIRHGRIDVVILALGVNDAYNMSSPSAKAIADRWRKVFKKVPALRDLKEKGVTVILISPPVGPTDMWGYDKAEIIMEALLGLAAEYEILSKEEGLIFADANTFGIELAFDGVHFTESGSATMYERVRDILEKCSKGE